MSIPPFLTPPPGVIAQQQENSRGTYATLDNLPLVPAPSGTALLVPGFTGSKEDFIALLAPLAERGVRGVALDLSGQYQTPVAGGSECSLAGFASDVWAVAGDLPRPLVLVGHSFGGLVVREAILSDPLAADGLVLIATGPGPLPEQQQQVLRRFVQVMDEHGLEAVWQAKRALDAAADRPAPPPDIDQFLTARFLSNAPGSLTAMITELCEVPDRVDELSTVAPPTVVVIGELDDAWPVEEQHDMAKRLDATVVALPATGHSPAVEDPESVADAIASLPCFS
ncbi:MAG TPA: alpha/beta hydrolase [Actinomycetes bacterium]|nr:alpha/beta hydrolase [Actinomycetes bacterium]